jgi:hypothetical protein
MASSPPWLVPTPPWNDMETTKWDALSGLIWRCTACVVQSWGPSHGSNSGQFIRNVTGSLEREPALEFSEVGSSSGRELEVREMNLEALSKDMTGRLLAWSKQEDTLFISRWVWTDLERCAILCKGFPILRLEKWFWVPCMLSNTPNRKF